MRVTAISDLHGYLPNIEDTDLLLIAGDWSPLEIQNSFIPMKCWIKDSFIPWMRDIKADKIVFIAGNHDFICDPNFVYPCSFIEHILNPTLRNLKLTKKIKYLNCTTAIYKKYRIYGNPYVEGCKGWAFSQAQLKGAYNSIPHCDILLTHQPPLFNSVGATVVKGKHYDFGSFNLLQAITKSKPLYHFFGHVHEGNHNPSVYDSTTLYNCSLKNEDYNVAFKPVSLEIPDRI